jgi:hypothetical protein
VKACTISAWWFANDDSRDAARFAESTIGFLKHLESVESSFANLMLPGTRHSPPTMERDRYCSYIKRKQFVLSVDNARLKGGRRVRFSAGVEASTHVMPGSIEVEASREFFEDVVLVRRVFRECIDYWTAEEAGVFCLDKGNWYFWYRWKRDGFAESPVPNIPWNDSPSEQEQLDGGLLSIWPQYAPRYLLGARPEGS